MKEVLKLLIVLSVIILAIVVGNKVIYKDDFAVIEGYVDTFGFNDPCLGCENDINYPTGFNMDNCVVVSAMVSPYIADDQKIPYGTFSINTSPDGTVKANMHVGVDLDENNIRLYFDNSTPVGFSLARYKIVLMKIK